MKYHFLLGITLFCITQDCMGQTMIIGHRGARGTHPENTRVAFEYAIKQCCDMIELDVRQCKSGEIIVIHDATVDRTTNGKGLVADLTLDQLKQFDAGNGQRLLTLQELFDLVDRRTKINIELKEPLFFEVAEIINHYLSAKGWLSDDFFVSSYLHGVLIEFHGFCSDVPLGFLDDNQIDPSKDVFSYPKASAVINYKAVDEAYIAALKQAEIPFIVYTVNQPNDIRKFMDAEIAGIITDYPERRACKE